MTAVDTLTVLRDACLRVGLAVDGAEPIRLGENAIYRLPRGVVARIARPGQQAAAGKEVVVARWLAESGISALQVFPDVEQPVEVDGRTVTFWRELPPHHEGTYLQVAEVIKRVHRLPIPDFLGPLEPFVRLADRIGDAVTLTEEDRAWLVDHVADLERRYNDLPAGLPTSVVHGDAHGGNIAATDDGGAILLDLERFAVGPPEWDLMLAAFDYGSVGWLPEAEYRAFADRYGYEVMDSPRYPVLRDIRELRKMLFAAQLAGENPALADQAAHRLACLQGRRGSRPWPGWHPVP